MLDRENIRIDLLKVRHKVYTSYPPYSEERKRFVREAKINALEDLSYSSQMMPKESMLALVDANKKLMVQDALKAGGFAIALAGLCFTYSHLHTVLEIALIILIQMGAGVGTFWYLRYIRNTVKSLKHLDHYYTELHKKMFKMTEDIRKLGGPGGFGF